MLSDTEMADILERAADLYEAEQYGWCRESFCHKNFITGDLSICALTALALAAGFIDHQHLGAAEVIVGDLVRHEDPQLAQLADALQVPACCPTHKNLMERPPCQQANKVMDWNDCVTREKEQEVIDLFKDAAKRLRNEA